MIDALVIARANDPAANKVIAVLSNHTSGNYSEDKVKYLTLSFMLLLISRFYPFISGSELHDWEDETNWCHQ